MTNLILVVGASGVVGSGVVARLKEQGHAVREASSKPNPGAGRVHLNLLTGEGRTEAFEGVDKAFFLSPAGYTNQADILIPLIQEAERRKLKKVVLMTAMGANANDELPLRRAEIALEQSGLNFNILRPNWFLQNFHTYWMQGIREQGKILVPGGTAKVSFIDARDIAAVAAKLLTSDQFARQAFELTGPAAVDHTEVAQALSKVSGKTIAYEEITPEQLKKSLLAGGVPEDYADLLNIIFSYLRQGYNAGVNDSVKQITGKDPISLASYAQDFQNQWR